MCSQAHFGQGSTILTQAIMAVQAGCRLSALEETLEDQVVILLR